MKLVIWTEAQAKQELQNRLRAAKDDRKKYESTWRSNEREIASARSPNNRSGEMGSEESFDSAGDGVEDGAATTSFNRILKNVRFLHSQMAANPPSVIPRPNTADQQDRMAALAADRTVRHIMRTYSVQEISDSCNLSVLYYGTGAIKLIQDPTKGEVLEFDPKTREILMEGDFGFSVPSVWDLFPRPCRGVSELSWIFERVRVAWEVAISKWPEHEEQLKKLRKNQGTVSDPDSSESLFRNAEYDVLEIYEYWEKGEPHNGMLGRFAYCLEDGTPLGPIKANPNYAKVLGDVPRVAKKGLNKKAALPYHFLTDIDVPNTFWGSSVVTHAVPLQQQLTMMMNTLLDAMEGHAVARLIMPNGDGDKEEDPISNSSFEVIRTSGLPGSEPRYVQPMPWPAIFQTAIEYVTQQIDNIMGVNENMFGQQSREQSALSMQTATNNGNMVRKRLFNKYVDQVQSVYKSALALAVEHWQDGKVIKVIGEENAFEVTDFKGADVESGYDIVVEYGTSLSLDPSVRREEILQMMPILEKAGIEARTLVRHIRLNELDVVYDIASLSETRQREYFNEMAATGKYIEPRKLEDHKYMLQFAYQYIMTAEFKYLPPQIKDLIDKHILAREALVVKGPETAAGAPPAAGLEVPGGAALPPMV